jgi:hypothetical protein
VHGDRGAYTEVLRVPGSWWGLGLVFVATVWWAFSVAAPTSLALAASAVALVLVVSGLLVYGGASICVDGAGVHAGGAHLPWRYVGAAVALDAEQTHRALGVEADARAYLVTRPYVDCAVKVVVEDARDPAPYWLVSTRHPAQLASRVNASVMQD